jgi:hypothetical protein
MSGLDARVGRSLGLLTVHSVLAPSQPLQAQEKDHPQQQHNVGLGTVQCQVFAQQVLLGKESLQWFGCFQESLIICLQNKMCASKACFLRYPATCAVVDLILKALLCLLDPSHPTFSCISLQNF